MTNKGNEKGARMEEALRIYFLEAGYFVIRGVDFYFRNHLVTDIDLWLYTRPSSLSRERTNVDIKNKKTPQAIERIFWTKGVQQSFGFENSIVATTDKRDDVRIFGLKNNVTVLDGHFLDRLKNRRLERLEQRLSEESFSAIINSESLGKLDGDWLAILKKSKSRLLNQLDFGGLIEWLNDCKFFSEKAFLSPRRKNAACRGFYLVLSYFLIGLDFSSKDIAFLDNHKRGSLLNEGFKYGSQGKKEVGDTIKVAIKLLSVLDEINLPSTSIIKKKLFDIYDDFPTGILTEYFNKNENSKQLFNYAKDLEELAYSRYFTKPTELSIQIRGLLSVILDYSGIERRKFFNAFDSSSKKT